MEYPIGIQDFEKIMNEQYLYIDKTYYIYNIVTGGCYDFFSRPRRFVKSLLISTLEAYFLGKKHLFEGLAISQKEKEWKKYPVLHLDTNVDNYTSKEVLDNILDDYLCRWEVGCRIV